MDKNYIEDELQRDKFENLCKENNIRAEKRVNCNDKGLFYTYVVNFAFPNNDSQVSCGFSDSQKKNYINEDYPFILPRYETLGIKEIEREIEVNRQLKKMNWSQCIWYYLNPYYAHKVHKKNKIIEDAIEKLENERSLILYWESLNSALEAIEANHTSTVWHF